MRILFLTTHNLATNPRLVKEVELALANDNTVELICFEFDNWSHDLNEELKRRLSNVKIHTINAGRNPVIPWLRNVFTEKSNRLVGKIFPLGLGALSQAVSRRSNMLIEALKHINSADLVIGHNPGALYPTMFAAKKFNSPIGFDVEDYHPGEGNNNYLQSLTLKLMTLVLPKMNYVSFAAPLIMQHMQKDCNITGGDWLTTLNYFPAAEFKEPEGENTGPITMVWFSQNINEGRGLELILPYVEKSKDVIELHLYGNLNEDFYENKIKGIENVIVHAPLEQRDLHYALAQFDIGLALEPAKDLNNKLAISNKILAYLQAGLYVLATNTPAQESFLDELPGHGVCFDYKETNVIAIFEKVINEITTIRTWKILRYNNFKNRNWESASIELLNVWNKIN